MAEEIKDENSEVINMGIFGVQVCSKLDREEALAWVRKASPAGTTNNWSISGEENHNAIPCSEGGGRFHYVFIC